MRIGSLFGVIATLVAIGTSTSAPAASPDWPKSLTLGTASPGGVYYIYGDALAKILTEKVGIAINPLPTQGPVHNVKLVDSGGAQLGLITMGLIILGTETFFLEVVVVTEAGTITVATGVILANSFNLRS